MTEPETLEARQAALLLHGLPAVARREVLARLDAAEHARLQQLLNELVELGVPASASTLPIDASAPSAQDRAAGLSADVVTRRLQSCAVATVALLLQARAWPWKAAVLDQMPSARRTEIIECLRSAPPPLAPAVLAYLCERLCAKAAHAPAVSLQPGVGLRRLIGWKR